MYNELETVSTQFSGGPTDWGQNMSSYNNTTGEPIMPYLIPDADFNLKLSLLDKNVEHTKSFIEKGVIDFHLPEATIPNGYRFVKALNKDEYRMVTTESGQPETVYAVKLLFRNDLVLNKETCTQIMVWRTLSFKHQIAASSLPRVFFKHLLNSYSIVVTDEETDW